MVLGLPACGAMGSNLASLADPLKTVLAADLVQVMQQDGCLTLTSSADVPVNTPLLNKMLPPTLSELQRTRSVVGGYIDTTPIGPQLKSMGISDNLDLSSQRAASLVTWLARNGVNPTLLSARGELRFQLSVPSQSSGSIIITSSVMRTARTPGLIWEILPTCSPFR